MSEAVAVPVAITKNVSGRTGSGHLARTTVATRAPTASTDSSDAPRAVLPKCLPPSSGHATTNMPNPTNATTDATVIRRSPAMDTIATQATPKETT